MQEQYAVVPYDKDTISTSQGNLVITFIGHGSLMFEFKGLVIQVDPTSQIADYSQFPKADIVLVTHHHGDHVDTAALNKIQKKGTNVYLTQKCFEIIKGINNAHVLKNGDHVTDQGIKIEAVPAYNIVHMRSANTPFHPRDEGNGYIVTLADKRLYVAGDTENTPEMKSLTGVDIAFLPMNLPYTMTPAMVADAVKAFKPKILYPYHYGDTNIDELKELLKDFPATEIRIRNMW
jgi:L-ascorbate metabolism protein UlaG (beta-lactamase superfamily)